MSEPKRVSTGTASENVSTPMTNEEKYQSLRAHLESLGMTEGTYDDEGFILPWNGGPPTSKEATSLPTDK